MHIAELTAPELRVLGCLIEKRWTTPDQYPLSLNALRLACNQVTNRDPVSDYDEATVLHAAQRLSRYGLTRLASGHSSRATKYRHLADEALGLGREELALLAVLLLRGPQTLGELKARSERMAPIASLAEVQALLDSLGRHGYANRLARRPGQKEDRYQHAMGVEDGSDAAAVANGGLAAHDAPPTSFGVPEDAAPPPAPAPFDAAPPAPFDAAPPAATPEPFEDDRMVSRLQALEAEVAELRAELEQLRLESSNPIT